MFTEKIFDTGAIKINYAEGAPNGAPLVTLHGATARWQELNPLINELEKDWHIYACDKRGHGKSSWGNSYTSVTIAADMSDFIKNNIGEPTVLIGHSAGGGVIRESEAEFFHAHISNGKAVQIKEVGHLIHVDQLEQMVELIQKWLKSNNT